MTAYAYHFHAQRRVPDADGGVSVVHGLITTEERVDIPEKYQVVCNDIAAYMGVESADDIVVSSLAFLHEVP